MEKRWNVSITIHLGEGGSPTPSHRCEPLGRDHPIAAFLHHIGGDGRRFRVESVGLDHATIGGGCTQEAFALLEAEMEEFFAVYGLGYGSNRWEVKRGDPLPREREVFEDGTEPVPTRLLTLTFLKEWAHAQQTPPVEIFFTALGKRLGWQITPPQGAVDHLELPIHTSLSVWRIWDEAQAVLTEENLAPHLVEFAVYKVE